MCGIVGYIGKQNAIPISLDGIKRLEYRGYDSAGAAFFDRTGKDIASFKAVGRVQGLEDKLAHVDWESPVALMHTRWATHGKPSLPNAHPHTDCKKSVWVAHNGIIENYKSLKESLIKRGHTFRSETDTEVLPHLVEEEFSGNLEEAVIAALRRVRGTYGLAVISRDDPQKIVAARNSSPLVIGVGEGEFIVASDASPILSYTKKVVYLEDNEVATLTLEGVKLSNLKRELLERTPQELEWSLEEIQKSGYPHFMLKEIFESPEVVENALRGRLVKDEGTVKLGGLEAIADKLREKDRLIITAMGTAYNAGLIGEYMLEEYAGIATEVENAAEFRYRKPIFSERTGLFTISQSGETADTLAALREAKRKGVLTFGITNVVGSTIARETEAGVYNHAGPEIGVASTKAFISQLSVLALLTVLLGRQRQMSHVMGRRIIDELGDIPQKIRAILKTSKEIKRLAKKYKDYSNFLYLGRKYNFPIALEGALKLKEISYVHAEGYGAAEMKHGPIALIDEDFPSFFIAPKDSVYEKVVSNMQEIKARKGPIIALTTKGNVGLEKLADDVIYIPKTLEMLTPILSVVPLQLFAYYVGTMRGYDVDKPRNLAKSVTVE